MLRSTEIEGDMKTFVLLYLNICRFQRNCKDAFIKGQQYLERSAQAMENIGPH